MPLLTWSDEYSVQIKKLDEQHKILVGLINKLHSALQEGNSKQVLGGILAKLIEYTEFHFSFEEKLLNQYDFQGKVEHQAIHNDLVKQVKELQISFEKEANFVIGIEVMLFLKNWLVKHILIIDMKYSAFLVSKGEA